MKKVISLILSCAALVLCLSSCNKKEAYNEDYYDGYAEGYSDGIAEAQDSISGYAEERFNDIDVADAIQVLRDYADGEPISEVELHEAIWTVNQFYNDAWDVIWDLDDYTID